MHKETYKKPGYTLWRTILISLFSLFFMQQCAASEQNIERFNIIDQQVVFNTNARMDNVIIAIVGASQEDSSSFIGFIAKKNYKKWKKKHPNKAFYSIKAYDTEKKLTKQTDKGNTEGYYLFLSMLEKHTSNNLIQVIKVCILKNGFWPKLQDTLPEIRINFDPNQQKELENNNTSYPIVCKTYAIPVNTIDEMIKSLLNQHLAEKHTSALDTSTNTINNQNDASPKPDHSQNYLKNMFSVMMLCAILAACYYYAKYYKKTTSFPNMSS